MWPSVLPATLPSVLPATPPSVLPATTPYNGWQKKIIKRNLRINTITPIATFNVLHFQARKKLLSKIMVGNVYKELNVSLLQNRLPRLTRFLFFFTIIMNVSCMLLSMTTSVRTRRSESSLQLTRKDIIMWKLNTIYYCIHDWLFIMAGNKSHSY